MVLDVSLHSKLSSFVKQDNDGSEGSVGKRISKLEQDDAEKEIRSRAYLNGLERKTLMGDLSQPLDMGLKFLIREHVAKSCVAVGSCRDCGLDFPLIFTKRPAYIYLSTRSEQQEVYDKQSNASMENYWSQSASNTAYRGRCKNSVASKGTLNVLWAQVRRMMAICFMWNWGLG